jgi:guanylate kinase
MGKLLIFSAPSGSGKTTIVREVLKRFNNLEFSISACSRAPRKGEVHAKDYYFLEVEDFKQRINNEEFVEWEEVYKDSFYGTLKSEVDRIWNNGNHVVFDVDVKGGLNIKKQFGEKALAIFIKPPSVEELRRRLEKRGTETQEQIDKRINKAEYELGFAKGFDVVILNDELEKAVEETNNLVAEFLNNK